jgi:hypothetical protein
MTDPAISPDLPGLNGGRPVLATTIVYLGRISLPSSCLRLVEHLGSRQHAQTAQAGTVPQSLRSPARSADLGPVV